jgi:programmed cell death 6-interacting protein
MRDVSTRLPCRYYKCMTAVETRFPISNEKGNVKLSFPWTDAFRPSKKTSQANVHFEKASVLFNVAAVMSQQALQVERGTAEGATQACKIFQVCQPDRGYYLLIVMGKRRRAQAHEVGI